METKYRVWDISTHSLTRRLTFLVHRQIQANIISTHSLTRRLTYLSPLNPSLPLYFNSQPHKEADLSYRGCSGRYKYFNSQPHKEADLSCFCVELKFFISTHSLTRRLTKQVCLHAGLRRNFNSQPHKEADQSITSCFHSTFHFNSQPHKEADGYEAGRDCRCNISTHSLTRRLTLTS